MSKEQLIKEFREKFGDRFTQVARYADKGWDEAYGKELARIEIDAESFLLSAFDAGRASGIEEVKELRRLHANCGWGFTANEYNEKVDEAIKALTPSSSKDN